MARNAVVTILIQAKNAATKVFVDVRRGLDDATRSAAALGMQAQSSIGGAFQRAMAAASAQAKELEKTSKKSLDGITDAAKRAAQALGLMWVVDRVFKAADAWKLAEGQLRIVTDSTEALRRAQVDLFDISQRTRTAYESNVTLYMRLARATKELNVDHEKLVRVTEAVALASTISAASQQQVVNGYYQLGQALALGKLQAQDARSIIEDLPRLGRAIAEGMGLSMGEFISKMHQGKITAQEMVDALDRVLPKLQNEFSQIPRTIGQAMVQLDNAFQRYIGTTDQALSATSALAAAIGFLANHLTLIGDIAFVVSIGRLSAALVAMTVRVLAATGAVEALTVAEGAAAVATTALSRLFKFFGGWVGIIITGAVTLGTALWGLINRHRAAAEAVQKHTEEIRKQHEAVIEQNQDVDRQIEAVERQRNALKRYGLAAAEQVAQANRARDKAAALWDKYRHANETAVDASLDFDEALAKGNTTALGFLARVGQLTREQAALAAEMKRAKDAQKTQTKEVKDAIAAMVDRINIERELVKLADDHHRHVFALLDVEEQARETLREGNLTLQQRLSLLRAIAASTKDRKAFGIMTGAETAAALNPKTGTLKPGLTPSNVPHLPPPKAVDLPKAELSFQQKLGLSIRDTFAAGERLDNLIANMASSTLQDFGSAIEDAFAAFADGSASAAQAFESAMLGAIASVAEGFGRYALGRATAAFAEGLLGDPHAFASAAEWTAAASALFAVAGGLKGAAHVAAGGGGRSSAAATSRSLSDAAGQGEATLVIEGGLLDMSDPRQADALAAAIGSLSGRRVTIKGRRS